jgi:hypothetical protein
MKELTLETLIAVFEEIFGRGLFWAWWPRCDRDARPICSCLSVTARSAGRSSCWLSCPCPSARCWRCGSCMAMTDSSIWPIIGGPVDIIVLFGIAAVGAIGAAILVYTAEALVGTQRTST